MYDILDKEFQKEAYEFFDKYYHKRKELEESKKVTTEEPVAEPPVFDANSESVSTGLSDEPKLGDSYFESVEMDANNINFEKGNNVSNNKESIVGKKAHLHGGKNIALTHQQLNDLKKHSNFVYITKLLKEADNIGVVEDVVSTPEVPTNTRAEINTETPVEMTQLNADSVEVAPVEEVPTNVIPEVNTETPVEIAPLDPAPVEGTPTLDNMVEETAVTVENPHVAKL